MVFIYSVVRRCLLALKFFLIDRCILRSEESEVVRQGLTSKMEMCDYFILYWTSGPVLKDQNSCTTKADFTWENYGLKNDPFLNAD